MFNDYVTLQQKMEETFKKNCSELHILHFSILIFNNSGKGDHFFIYTFLLIVYLEKQILT